MRDKFNNKYRIPSTRLQNWDYTSEGAYFITICTKNFSHFFGEIDNGKMQLSNIGIIADVMWHEVKNHRKNIDLGAFVVMPNHIHIILFLNDIYPNHCLDDSNKTPQYDSNVKPTEDNSNKNQAMSQISPKANSVSSIIGSYKSSVSKHARRLGLDFAWQPRFHDHIIRDTQSFENIEHYINSNVENWGKDKFHP